MGDEMFFGEFRHSIDVKGRLSIPSVFRGYCGKAVYVTKGHEGCLALYTEEGWDEYYKKLQALPRSKKTNRIFVRMVTSKVKKCEFDKLGRINIPTSLRTEGNLDKDCVVIGVGDYVEIWDEKTWDQFYEDNKDDFDLISEELED